jgi:thymidine kinase
MAVAEIVLKSNAICVVCGGMASRTQRLGTSTAQVEVGATGLYEARCRGCFDPHLAEKIEANSVSKNKKKKRSPSIEARP